MIRQRIYLPSYRWTVFVFYDVGYEDAKQVVWMMEDLGAGDNAIIDAWDNLTHGPNNGLTWSDFDYRVSVMAIGHASSPEEYWDTLDHEKGHLATHIATACRIEPEGEERQYLSGDLAKMMFPIASQYVCECLK